MRKSWLLAGAALAAAGFAAGAAAQEVTRFIGATPSHHSDERYDMSVGVTAGQQPRRPVGYREDREVFVVPSHYGDLVGMTGDSKETVLWFKDGSGSLRNVVVHDTATRFLKLQASASSRYEVDVREQ